MLWLYGPRTVKTMRAASQTVSVQAPFTALLGLLMALLNGVKSQIEFVVVVVRYNFKRRMLQVTALRASLVPGTPFPTRVMTNIQIGAIFGIIILEIVGFALLPTIYSAIKSANSSGAITGSSATVANLVPLLYILVLFAAPVIVLIAVFS